MTAEKFLEKRVNLDKALKCKFEQLKQLEEVATKISASTSHSTPNGTSDRVGKTVAKIIDLKCEICDDIDELINLKCQLRLIINAVPNPMHRTILERKFILLNSSEVIAEQIGYSVPQTKRIYKEAKKIFEKMIPNDIE